MRAKILNGPIRVEDEMTLRAAVVAGLKNFNIDLREVIFGCCVTNTYDDDTMSPDVDINH